MRTGLAFAVVLHCTCCFISRWCHCHQTYWCCRLWVGHNEASFCTSHLVQTHMHALMLTSHAVQCVVQIHIQCMTVGCTTSFQTSKLPLSVGSAWCQTSTVLGAFLETAYAVYTWYYHSLCVDVLSHANCHKCLGACSTQATGLTNTSWFHTNISVIV